VKVLGVFAITALAVFAAPLSTKQPATASCVGPTVKFKPARVARGAVLTITGEFFGDDCADTGTVPPGVGPLGNPLTGLAIVIDQGANEFVVATGSADDKYEFRVEVVVPTQLEPGEATLNVVGAGDARLTVSPSLVISGASPPESAEVTVATFGPTTTEAAPTGTDPPSVLPAEIPDVPIATAPPLSVAPVVADNTNRDLQIAIGVGVAGVVAIGLTAYAVWGRSRRRG
jgi:hypothetical protein